MYHRLAGSLARGTYRAATRVYSTEVPKDAEVVVIGECELVQLWIEKASCMKEPCQFFMHSREAFFFRAVTLKNVN